VGDVGFHRLVDAKKAAELSQRISALERMRQDLARLAKWARAAPPGPEREAAFCHIIEGRGLRESRNGP
jgi:hypothetical protein